MTDAPAFLSEADLFELEGLCKGATPGPWAIGGISIETGSISIRAEHLRIVIADVTNAASFGEMIKGAIRRGDGGFHQDDCRTQFSNAGLLAMSRDAIPRLIAEIRHSRSAQQIGAVPAKPGFYWAKWRIADDGTVEGDDLTPSDVWEVVHVTENTSDKSHPEYLRVSVSGVQRGQALENFFWGPGPLPEPPSAPPKRTE